MHEPSNHTTARLLLLMTEFGQTVSRAMAAATREPDLIGNAPILVLSSIDLSGPKRPADLAKLTRLTSGGLSKLLDRMEGSGVIRREHGGVPGDRRGVLVCLTERGVALLRVLTAELHERLPETRALVHEIVAVLEA